MAVRLIARIECDIHTAWVSQDSDPFLETDIQEIIMAKLEKGRDPNLFEGVRFKCLGFEHVPTPLSNADEAMR